MQWSRIQINKYVMSCHAHKDFFFFNTKVVPIDDMLNKGSAFYASCPMLWKKVNANSQTVTVF